jgi:long-chain fatty acid transport protein
MQKLNRQQIRANCIQIAIVLFFGMTMKVSVYADGINRNGTGAESMAMGGADVGWAKSPLEAMGDNPAGLGFLTQDEFDLGGVGASASGRFSKPSVGSSGALKETPAGLPEGALGIRFGKNPIAVGVSFIPESMQLAHWNYQDPPGGLGGTTTYGNQEDKSEILVLRSAVGVGVQLSPKLSLGLSVGAVYNKNELVTPYIFQNLSAGDTGFNGAKTLLDLDTSGFGWNAQIGMLYCPLTNLQFGLTYQNKYKVVTTGDATGDPYAQFHTTEGPLAFHYNAEVDNTFPDQFALGGSWKFLPNWRLAAEVDWIDWANAFNTLPVKLSNGTGVPAGSGLLGPSFQDYIPLSWKSEFVYRIGLEWGVTDNLFLRAGYCYGGSPVPDSTLNPMTASIMENTITAGIGYRWRACEFDLAYQYDLPETQRVATSSLLSGEYSNSSTKVSINWLAVTMRYSF